MTEPERADLSTPQGRMSYAMRWLAEHPGAPLTERASCAVVVACAGDVDADCTLSEAAHYAGCEPHEVMQALLAVREQGERDD